MDPLEALAEPARRRILDILASGEHTAGQIADVVGYEFHISRTAVSKHLRHLRDARLVDVRGEAGRVQFDDTGRPANHTDLSPQTCKALRHLSSVDFTCIERADCGFKEFNAGWAAHTLAHESFHLRGFQDEGVTECYALQNTAFVAERLGVPTQPAKELQAWLFKRGFPNEPTEYQSSQCHDGGPLDLRPQQTLFP